MLLSLWVLLSHLMRLLILLGLVILLRRILLVRLLRELLLWLFIGWSLILERLLPRESIVLSRFVLRLKLMALTILLRVHDARKGSKYALLSPLRSMYGQ